MNTLTLAIALLATPFSCPSEGAQVRWAGVKIKAGKLRIDATVWDRNRDGQPSAGDLMRVDRARKGRKPVGGTETWALIRGSLAKGLKRAARHRRVRAACDPLFLIENVPKASNGRALARLIRANGGDSPGPTRRDRARTAMSGWAARVCGAGRPVTKAKLRQTLEAKGLRRYGSLGRGTVRRLAEEVAQENAVSCANLKVAKGFVF